MARADTDEVRVPHAPPEFDHPHPVIDLGAGTNPDARATHTTDLHAEDVDFQFDLRNRWPFPDDSAVGLVARHVFEHISHEHLREHVFPEAARVLRDDGWLEIRVPVGSDARSDPTHVSTWEWRTPEFYADNWRHWHPDHGLVLVERELRAWMIGPLGVFNPLVRRFARWWPCEFWYECPGVTGELIARYRPREAHARE